MHFVPEDREADPLQNRFVQFLFLQVRELDKLVATDTTRVMVTLLIVKMFEMMMLLPESGLADDPRLEKFLKDAVNCRPGDLAPFMPALLQKFFRREMSVGVHDLIENDAAPAGKLQAARFKVVFVFFLFVDNHIMIQCLI